MKAKAYLIDPKTGSIIWMNESARRDRPDIDPYKEGGPQIEKTVHMARELGIMEALSLVAETGETQHLHAGVIHMRRGTLEIAASLYPLPDGKLLLLIENAWQMKRRTNL